MRVLWILLFVFVALALSLAMTSVILYHTKPRKVDFTNPPLGGVYLPVVAASTEGVDLNECPARVDGVLVELRDRLLLKDQNPATENGIYEVKQPGQWERASDMRHSNQLHEGNLVFVQRGNQHRQATFSLRIMHAHSVTKKERMAKADKLFVPMFENLFGSRAIPDHSILTIDRNVPQNLAWKAPEEIEEDLLTGVMNRPHLLRYGAFVEQNDRLADNQKEIPRVLHQLFGFWDSAMPHAWMQNHEWWKESHDEFTVKLWNKSMCDDLIAEHFPESLEWFQSLESVVQQADIARYFVLAHEGGWYIDLDCTLERETDRLGVWMRRWRHPRLVLFQEEGKFVNYVMGSTAKHPMWLSLLGRIKDVEMKEDNGYGASFCQTVWESKLDHFVDLWVGDVSELWCHLQAGSWENFEEKEEEKKETNEQNEEDLQNS